MIYRCPLCNSADINHLERVSIRQLNKLWHRALGVSTLLKMEYLDYLGCRLCGLGFFSPMETGDEELYEKLQQKYGWYYTEDKKEFKIASAWVGNGSLLEVGSGKAAFARYLRKENYTGLEFSEAAIREASKNGVSLVKQSVEEHAAKGNRYDFVASFQVLEHVASPRSFLQGCVDCLKPGGKLIVAIPSRDGFLGLASNQFLDMPPHHVTHWTEKPLAKVADIFNLKLVDVQHEPIAEYHKKVARAIVLESLVKKKFGIESGLLEERLSVCLMQRLIHVLSGWLKPDLSDVKGHTVVSLFEK